MNVCAVCAILCSHGKSVTFNGSMESYCQCSYGGHACECSPQKAEDEDCEIANWHPKPIDTGEAAMKAKGVEAARLTELYEVAELLAINIHEEWSLGEKTTVLYCRVWCVFR